MKHSTQLIRSLLGLTVLLASCQVDDSPGILSDSEARLFVSEACNYYEQTISEAAEKSKLVQNKNMSPGEVTPCWHKAHIKQDANYEYVYVPIIAGNNYIRRVKIGKEGEKKKYRIPISQTLCVRRDKTGNYDAAYVTIMPSLNYYRANKSTFTEKVIHDKSLYGNLSGYVAYNDIVSSKLIVADRVKSGKCLWSYSPATFKDKALSRKIKQEIFQNIHNIGMSLTRNTIDGGWLEEVEITPDGEDDDDDEDYFCGFCAEYVPYGHICSEDEEVEELPSGGGVWGGGGGSPGGGGSGSQPTNIAPRAKALFRNSSMTDTNWAVIENLLKKIMSDCMGEALYNGLKSALNGKTLTIKFTNKDYVAFVPNGGNSGIELGLTVVESNAFFHEMWHAYQAYHESESSYMNSLINQEIEAHYAQYLYVRQLPEYAGSKWENYYAKDRRMGAIKHLSDHIDEKGYLRPGKNIKEFDFEILSVVSIFETTSGYDNPNFYKYDDARSGLSNFSNLRTLTKNC